jgi:glycerol kinase
MDPERRDLEYDNWQRAVERSLGWIKPPRAR